MTRDGRLPRLHPAALSPAQRDLYDEITGGPRGAGPQLFELTDPDGALTGPFNAMLLSPPVGGGLQALGRAVRYGSVLPPRVREMAILLVAADADCSFERYAHEAVGRSVGLTPAEIEVLNRGRVPDSLTPTEAAAGRVVQALLLRRDLDDTEYSAGREALGERILFELTTLVCYYATLALQLRLFRVDAPPVGGLRP